MRLPIVSPRQLAAAQQQLPSPSRGGQQTQQQQQQPLQPPVSQRAKGKKGTKTRSKLSMSSSEQHSDNSGSGSDEHINNKAVSDKKKNDTLRKLFWTSKGDSGAKGKGQVLIVDGSEEAQQQQQQQLVPPQQQTQIKDNAVPAEKLLSPFGASAAGADKFGPSVQVPTRHSNSKHAKNTASIPPSNSYSNNINNNNNNPLLKCPSAMELQSLNNKSMGQQLIQPMPLVCRIDLSRLSRIPDGSRHRNANQYNRNSSNFSGTRPSRASNMDDDAGSRLINSRDSSTSSSSSSDSLQREAESRKRYDFDTNVVTSVNDIGKHSGSSSGYNSIDSRLGHCDSQSLRGQIHSPKSDEKPIGKSAIKHESLKNEFTNEYNSYAISPPLKGLGDKMHSNQQYIGSKGYGGSNENIKRESIKMETTFGDKLSVPNEHIPNNRKKRASSANSSPYKDKKRKKHDDQMDTQTGPPTNHDRLDDGKLSSPMKPIIQKVYYSYFERSNDERDEIR